MAKPELVDYIKRHLEKGHKHSVIKKILKKAGHEEKVILEAFEDVFRLNPHLKKSKRRLKKDRVIVIITLIVLFVVGAMIISRVMSVDVFSSDISQQEREITIQEKVNDPERLARINAPPKIVEKPQLSEVEIECGNSSGCRENYYFDKAVEAEGNWEYCYDYADEGGLFDYCIEIYVTKFKDTKPCSEHRIEEACRLPFYSDSEALDEKIISKTVSQVSEYIEGFNRDDYLILHFLQRGSLFCDNIDATQFNGGVDWQFSNPDAEFSDFVGVDLNSDMKTICDTITSQNSVFFKKGGVYLPWA